MKTLVQLLILLGCGSLLIGCPPPDPIDEVPTITVVNGFVRVNNDPLFPTGAYFWPDHAKANGHHPLDDVKSIGGNVVVAYYDYVKPGAPAGGAQLNMAELTAAATARQLYFFVGQPRAEEIASLTVSELTARLQQTADVGKTSKYFLGFMLDEPPNAGYSLELVQRYAQAVRAAAPGRLLWINFAPDTLSDWHWTASQWQTAGNLADIVSGDLYPVPERHCAGWMPQYMDCSLTDPGRFVADLAARFPQKALWFIQQANRWQEYTETPPANDRFPTLAETRYLAIDSLVSGARGLYFFGITHWGSAFPYSEPIFAQTIPTVTAELQQLAPYLISGTRRSVSSSDGEIAGIAYTLAGKTLLLLVSRARQSRSVTLQLNLGAGEWSVGDLIDGGAVGTCHNGQLQLQLPGLAARALLLTP